MVKMFMELSSPTKLLLNKVTTANFGKNPRYLELKSVLRVVPFKTSSKLAASRSPVVGFGRAALESSGS